MKEDEYDHLEPVDQDTLPNERSVRDMTERIETQVLAAEAYEIETGARQGIS